MLAIFSRKKIREDKLANVLVNSFLEMTEKGFAEIADTINEDQSFVTPPKVNAADHLPFLKIILAGNLDLLKKYLPSGQDKRVRSLVVAKMSEVLETPRAQFESQIAELSGFMKRVNHPSKNTLYAMNKALFYKYELNGHQDDYFKNMNAPNPLFLNRINDLTRYFVWDWSAFLEDYKITN